MDMIKKMRTFFLSMLLCLTLGVGEVEAQNAKARALGSMALYGTIGGALLGTATLAFGSSARSIAQGASLGLYAGLIFGSYVVLSHSFQAEYDDEYGLLYSHPSKRYANNRLLLHEEAKSYAYSLRKEGKARGWNFFVPILAMNY